MPTNYPGDVNFEDAVTMEDTLDITGLLNVIGSIATPTISTSVSTRLTKTVFQNAITTIATQDATLTIAQILGSIIKHTVITGAGTVTLPTGTLMSGGIVGVATGTTIKWMYINTAATALAGTLTAGTDHTIVGGTAEVTQGKYVLCTSICTAVSTKTWVTYLTTLF